MQRHRKHHKKRKYNLIFFLLIILIFGLTIGYSAFSTNINLSVKGNIKDKSRVIQSWNLYSNKDFHSAFYKENIISATFTDTAVVPSNAVEKWDVSETKDKGVMAYVTESPVETGKYDLYIGAKKGIIANNNSGHLFYNFINIENINFNKNYDTDNVTDMTQMFQNCKNLTKIDLSSFNTQNVTSMLGLFSMWDYKEQSKLVSINLSNFDTQNVTNMRDIFAYNPNLTEIIGLETFNTSKVENMQGMFVDDINLKEINLKSFNTSNVTNMWQMFTNCKSLEELDLCSFNTVNVTDMRNMFYGTTKLKKIYVGSRWNIEFADTSYMFDGSAISSVTTGQCNNK